MSKGLHVLFSGRVQGVGFRFVARQLADRYSLKGWAQNTSDGRVELVIEGSSQSLDDFTKELNDKFSGKITNVLIDDIDPSGGYKSFEIR